MASNRRMRLTPINDRPREKLRTKGAAALSDFELLEVIIGSGTAGTNVGAIARQVYKLLQKGPGELTYDALLSLRGVNIANAGKILASLELAQRHLIKNVEPLRAMPEIIAHLSDIRTRQQEYLVVLSLDGGQRLIAQRTVTIGTLDTVMAHPREIYSDPLTDRAASIIVAHNHPSGSARPSVHDTELTQQLAAAGQLLGVSLRDHIILTKTDYFSFRQHHLL